MKKRSDKWSLGGLTICLLKTSLLILVVCTACQTKTSQQSDTSDFDPDRDYFPEKVEIKHAIGFDIEYHNHYKVLHLFRHYNDVADTMSYVLVQRGTPNPEGQEGKSIITVPATNIVTISTTQVAMFEMLEALDQLKGVEIKQYISSQEVVRRVEQGEIAEVAPAGTLNTESVIDLGAEAVLGVGYPNAKNEAYQQLERTGIPVLLNADWQERDLLGRAEWVKLLAALLNKEELVNAKFEAIEDEYNRVLDKIQREVKDIPVAITGIAQGDVWHVSGGRSFAYNTLKTARVDYPWKDDTSTGGLKLDFETVYEQGLKADYWIAPSVVNTLQGIIDRDTRYADFKSFKTGQIYNIYGRYAEGGGNDYYEKGMIEPHVVLKDIVKIFHPELLPDHELVYYSQLK